jgi:hypothetical protein
VYRKCSTPTSLRFVLLPENSSFQLFWTIALNKDIAVDPSELGTDNTCSAGASWSSESLLRDNDDVTL